jgi:hypothetical protein
MLELLYIGLGHKLRTIVSSTSVQDHSQRGIIRATLPKTHFFQMVISQQPSMILASRFFGRFSMYGMCLTVFKFSALYIEYFYAQRGAKKGLFWVTKIGMFSAYKMVIAKKMTIYLKIMQ